MVVRVAVAAANRLAAQAGVDVAAGGGNSVDAAVAAVLTTMVTEPGMVSLAAGGYITLTAPGEEPLTVDGGVEMPGRDRPQSWFGGGVREIYSGYGGGVTMTVGHGSVATPGALAALALIHQRSGRAPWSALVGPAVRAVESGFPLGRSARHYLEFVHDSAFGWQADSHAALHGPDGALLGPEEAVRIPALMASLKLLASEGVETFYRGRLAELIVADMDAHSGLLGARDLAEYEAVSRVALSSEHGRWRLSTNPAPAVGGVTLTAMLALLAGRPRGNWSAQDIAHLVAVQEAVLSYRINHFEGSADRVAAARVLLQMVDRRDLAAMSSPSTAHVSVAGDDGVACAITVSAGYGSGVMTPGTGIWQNNCLGEPELNRGGLHTLAPGTRLLSNMAPTVATRADGAVLAIGSPGADRISTALAQVLAGHMHGGRSLEQAISDPRAHVRVGPTGTEVDIEAGLAVGDLPLSIREFPAHSMYFGGVGAAWWEPDTGLHAAADPRRVGAVQITPP
ncbi:MAG: gamma-glutamyltransferase [Actinomycetota bacterium]|nr:gamma-glutamyltransferase [Actinomycetota bacterium]